MSTTARPIAAVLLAAVLFGTAGTAQELGPAAATPLGIGTVRVAIGVVVLWAAIALTRRRWDDPDVGRMLAGDWRLFVVGGVGVATYTPMFLAAVDRTGVAVGTVIAIGSGPFFAGALEWVWRGVRPRRGWLVGTAITVAGGILLVGSQASQTAPSSTDSFDVDGVGVVFALLAGGGYALYSVTAKVTMGRGVHPTLALAAPFTAGAVVLAALAVREPFDWLSSRDGLLIALHLGIAATGAAYLLFGYGLHRLTTATTVTLVLAEPLTATLLATLVLDESIVVLGWLGIVVLCAGLYVVGRTAEVSFEPLESSEPLGVDT